MRATKTAGTKWQDVWEAMRVDVVRTAFSIYMHEGMSRRLFLYFRRADPGAGAWGRFAVVAEGQVAPEGYELAVSEAIPADTRERMLRWLRGFDGQLPMIGSDGHETKDTTDTLEVL